MKPLIPSRHGTLMLKTTTRRALILCATLALAACGNDDNNDNNGPIVINNNTSGGTDLGEPDMGEPDLDDPDPVDMDDPDPVDMDPPDPDMSMPPDMPEDMGDDFNPLQICLADCNYMGPRADEVDCDYDGLSNTEEATLGTDPCDNDTDGDGLTDLRELQEGTDARALDRTAGRSKWSPVPGQRTPQPPRGRGRCRAARAFGDDALGKNLLRGL